MTTLYPARGEKLPDLARRVLDRLPPADRARVQVVTGGSRVGLLLPATAPPARRRQAADPAPSAGIRPAPAPRRAQRRRSKE